MNFTWLPNSPNKLKLGPKFDAFPFHANRFENRAGSPDCWSSSELLILVSPGISGKLALYLDLQLILQIWLRDSWVTRSQPMWSRMLLLRVSLFCFCFCDRWEIFEIVWGYVHSFGDMYSHCVDICARICNQITLEFPCVWLSSLQPVYNRKSNKNNDDLGVPRFSNISHLHADGIHAKIVAVQRARLDLLWGNVGTSKN